MAWVRKEQNLLESFVKTNVYFHEVAGRNSSLSSRMKYGMKGRIKVSSRKSVKERKIDMLLEQLFVGDTLIVSELSRMGRSVGEIITIIDILVKKQIRFLAIKEGIRLDGSQDCEDIQTKVMITLFGLFSEIERKLVSMRTREALAAAKAAGKKLGRPRGMLGKSRLDTRKDEIMQLLALGVPKTIIARITGVDRSTIYHFIESRGLV